MPYTYTPAQDPMAVAEQGFSTDPEIRFTPFTSCIGLLASHADINVDDVTAIHLVMVGADGTIFNNLAADNAVALLGAYRQVVVIGSTTSWARQPGLNGAFQHLIGLLDHPIIMDRDDGTYGGRIHAGQFQIYDNGHYVNVPAAEVNMVPAAPAPVPGLAGEAAVALAMTPLQWADVTYAAQQWANLLQDSVDINVQVWWVDMAPANQALGLSLNAMCIPGIVQTGGQTLTRAQAKRSGALAFNDPGLDMLVVLDSGTPWLTGTGANAPVVPNGQYSLATTVLHELCHGLGFLGLCNVDSHAQTGTYSDPNLVPLVQAVAAHTQPPVTIPPNFFPPNLAAGQMTPLAGLFRYTNPALHQGMAADDYTAFTSGTMPASITVQGSTLVPPQPAPSTVLTGQPFAPFTNCDHVTTANCLMNPTTSGRYYGSPDVTTLNLVRAIGWTV